jgi:hypothetical protein
LIALSPASLFALPVGDLVPFHNKDSNFPNKIAYTFGRTFCHLCISFGQMELWNPIFHIGLCRSYSSERNYQRRKMYFYIRKRAEQSERISTMVSLISVFLAFLSIPFLGEIVKHIPIPTILTMVTIGILIATYLWFIPILA